MAYVEKYSGKFTSLRGAEYDVVLYQDGGSAGSKDIKLQNVTFNRTLNDRFLTTSVDIIFLNDYTFNEFDDLCSATEKEWLVQITEYGDRTNVYFRGWLAINIIERDFSREISSIKITATDGLLKLKEIEVEDIEFGSKYSLKDIITTGLWEIDTKNTYINSALFYESHTATDASTLFEQTFLDGDYLYKNNVETLTYWDAINNILKPLNCYVYAHKNNYYIERYNDISTNEDWAVISSTTGLNSTATSKHESYNKQSNFDYTEASQTLSYESGLSDFTLNINPAEYSSILPNKQYLPLSTCDYAYVLDGSLNFGDWTIFKEAHTISTGSSNYNMNNYLKYDSSTTGIYTGYEREMCPIFFKTKITYNDGETTKLQLKWKHYIVDSHAVDPEAEYSVRFTLRLGSDGPVADHYIINFDGSLALYTTGYGYDYMIWKENAKETEPYSRVIEFSKTIDLEQLKGVLSDNQTIIFGLYPLHISDGSGDRFVYTTVIGDYEVKVISENVDNQYLYAVNDGFINKKEEDLNIFDINNYNFNNGLFLSDGTKTDPSVGWSDDGGSTYDSLINHYVKNEVGYYYKTRKGLSANILFKDAVFIKPLCFINDNHLPGIDFVAKEYSLNMGRDIYSFSGLQEYSTEKGEINIIE
jgi:hypothetical protein